MSRNLIFTSFLVELGDIYFDTRLRKNYSRNGFTKHSLEAARKNPAFTGAMAPCNLSYGSTLDSMALDKLHGLTVGMFRIKPSLQQVSAIPRHGAH